MDIQWKEDGARYKALTVSLGDAHNQAMGKRRGGKEPLVPWKKMTDWSTAHKILGLWIETENMTIGLL